MREVSMQMFRDSVDAYVREDVELGRALKARDKVLDCAVI
jgi:phosphate uptake regulator